MKPEYVKLEIPPELIADYERERVMGVQFDPSDWEEEPTEYDPVKEADWITYDDVLQQDAVLERHESVSLELQQRKGTKMLYVVEVSKDGKRVRTYASDGTSGIQVGKRVG